MLISMTNFKDLGLIFSLIMKITGDEFQTAFRVVDGISLLRGVIIWNSLMGGVIIDHFEDNCYGEITSTVKLNASELTKTNRGRWGIASFIQGI